MSEKWFDKLIELVAFVFAIIMTIIIALAVIKGVWVGAG